MKDINETPARLLQEKDYSNIFISCNGYLFFTVENQFGREIWKTDGTLDGTIMVADLNPGSANGIEPSWGKPVCVGKDLFFTGDNGKTGSEIFKTDGTMLGTVLVKDHNTTSSGSNPHFLTSHDNSLYYFVRKSGVLTLRKSDGTAEGSELISSIGTPPQWPSITASTASEGNLFFTLRTNDELGVITNQLWKSDGTAEGTSLLFKTNSYIDNITSVGGNCFFTLSNIEDGAILMKSDGTIEGTMRVIDHNFLHISRLYKFNDKVIFDAGSLWISDGTESGTFKLTNNIPVGGRVVNELFYTLSNNPQDDKNYLLSSDGTVEGTKQLVWLPWKNIQDIRLKDEIAMIGQNFIIPFYDEETGQEIGISNATAEGTRLLKDINPGSLSSLPRSWAELDGKVYFIANDDVHGSEIWGTNGTESGTTLIADVRNGTQNSNPRDLLVINDRLLFTAEDNSLNVDVWTTNGIQEGAMKYLDFEVNAFYLGRTNNYLYYKDGYNIYKTTGGEDGRTFIMNFSAEGNLASAISNLSFSLGEYLIFYLDPYYTTGGELWVTDGTEDGTGILKDINPGSASSILNFDGTELNGQYLFAADDGIHGNELWTTDGTEGGTKIIKDLYAGTLASNPRNFTTFGDQVLFSAEEDQNGYSVWKTDGTDAGTIILKELTAETSGSNIPFIAKAGTHLIVAVNNEMDGSVLWKSDGTEEGTMVIREDFSSISQYHKTIGGTAYFTASDETNGTELWVSDGTSEGTYPIDISPGIASSFPSNFIAVEELVYFKANNQLWRSNGTEEYTELVADVEPINMAYLDGYIYFSMATEEYGIELFKIPFSKYDQNITFDPIPVKIFEDDTFQLVANSSSGLPVAFSTTSENIQIEEDNIVSLLQAGPVSIEANQEGNNLFNAATSVTQNFCINPLQPTISVVEEGGVIKLISSSESHNQWFRNGFLLSGQNDQNLVLEETGAYTVQVNIGECLSAMSSEENMILTSILENNKGMLALFPNPVSDNLYVEFDVLTNPASMEIVDMAGKSHGFFNLENPLSEISLNYLLSGVYVVKIYYKNNVLLSKLVKE